MALKNPPTPSLQSQTDRILAEQAVIRRYREQVRALRSRVLAYEEQFGIPSSEIHEAIEAGRLQETLDVTCWIMDFERLTRATDFDE